MSQDGRSARAKNIYDEAHKNLVDSAIELFNNPDIPNGKINLSLIAKEAGTSVATAYNHFPENLIDVFGSIFNIAFEKIVDAVTEFMPQSFTPLIIKGITVVFSLIPDAFPQAATIPASLTWDKTFDKTFPPTVSTAPS